MSTYAIIKLAENKLKLKLVKQFTLKNWTLKLVKKLLLTKLFLLVVKTLLSGTPLVAGATVVGTVEKQGKQKKVVTYKYKPKKGSHRKQGHRQPYTKVVINAINA